MHIFRIFIFITVFAAAVYAVAVTEFNSVLHVK